jgi:hypothetical protein
MNGLEVQIPGSPLLRGEARLTPKASSSCARCWRFGRGSIETICTGDTTEMSALIAEIRRPGEASDGRVTCGQVHRLASLRSRGRRQPSDGGRRHVVADRARPDRRRQPHRRDATYRLVERARVRHTCITIGRRAARRSRARTASTGSACIRRCRYRRRREIRIGPDAHIPNLVSSEQHGHAAPQRRSASIQLTSTVIGAPCGSAGMFTGIVARPAPRHTGSFRR